MYHQAKQAVDADPPEKKREELWVTFDGALSDLINRYMIISLNSTSSSAFKFQKALEYFINGHPNWLTFILVPGLESTNNRAERDLREVVILRKIKECLRSETSVHTLELFLSILKTARMQHLHLEEFLYNSLTGQRIPEFTFDS